MRLKNQVIQRLDALKGVFVSSDVEATVMRNYGGGCQLSA